MVLLRDVTSARFDIFDVYGRASSFAVGSHARSNW
jgi:hypothetical protein